MLRASLLLDPAGELLALTTNANVKNIILGALDLRGPLDPEAMREAIRIVGDTFPKLKMRLREVKERGRHYLIWDNQSGVEIPFVMWDVRKTDLSGSNLDILLRCLEKSLTRERNLFEEPACEVHLLKLNADHHMLACVMSHVAADAITLAEIVKEFMTTYHEMVTGQKPTFSRFHVSASTRRKRAGRRKKTVWRDYWRTFRQALIPYVRCTLPAGNGSPDDRDEHHVKELLSQEESEKIVAESLRMKISLVDYLLANATVAIDQWNKSQNIESGAVTAAVTVNMQGRFQDRDGPNNDSVLYFQFGPEQRKDAETLARSIFFARISQFRYHMDLKYSKAIGKLNNFFRIFPFKPRQKAFVQILQRHQTSFALGFMGVLWPAADGRKMSGDSYLTSAGGLTITEVHGIAYKLLSRTPLYLSAYFFQKRLNLVLSAAAWQFTREEAQAFLGLVVDLLRPETSRISR